MVKPADQAHRPDFKFGAFSISPSRRLVEGPAGKIHVEPLVMQVFLMLVDARDSVVTRAVLFDRLWGGVMVGDDSLNRAIAGVRRIGAETGPGLFDIETVPRTGYRLTCDSARAAEPEPRPTFDRRMMIAGGAVAVIAGAGLVWSNRETTDPRFALLMEQGHQTVRDAWPGSKKQGVALFSKAVAMNPASAEAWGMLALAQRNAAEQSKPGLISAAVEKCESAARRALAIDPNEPNALTALATVHPEFGDWGTTEDALRKVLAVSPDNGAALTYLVMLLQSVGHARESWDLNERVAKIEPLSPVHQYRRAMKHWIFGRNAEADLTIDRAMQLWPGHPAIWSTRLYIFAFTDRAEAARAMIRDTAIRPKDFSAQSLAQWEASLDALESGKTGDVARASKVNVEVAPRSPGFATRAIMILSKIGNLDMAFAVAEGSLLRRGPLIGTLWAGKGDLAVNDHFWRRTMNLFTPATDPMRRDPRFRSLCEGIGLTDYWTTHGGPDPRFVIA